MWGNAWVTAGGTWYGGREDSSGGERVESAQVAEARPPWSSRILKAWELS